MAKNLVIVESPAKAKTIEKYLGKDFQVLSSVGHIRSIVKKTKDGTPPIDIKNGFKTIYEVDPEKKKVVAQLRKAAKSADNIYLATDPDREGEAIAWHLCEVLKLDPSTTKRITYHEISKSAVEKALEDAHTIDMSMVRAQQARQILDRLVGFELSPVVWQKVPGGKSAGRVQSPAVRLLVEREREIAEFEGSSQFKITALFVHNGNEFKAELKPRFDTEEEAKSFLESIKDANFIVSDVTKSPSKRNPGAPFTTSTLQQEANAKLGMSSKATMTAAQRLYQAGRITYMRTDSVNLSSQAIAAAADYIKKLYGVDYSQVRKFKTKSSSAQEAHEAIRPTDITREEVSGSEQKLYDLIRRRTLASQMSSAKLEKTTVTISISTQNKVFEAKGEVVVFDGFLRVYGGGKEEILPKLSSGDSLRNSQAEAKQVFARPPARYSEGSLVKKLEELGIGRPSTYATIIDTIQTRGYVERGDSEGKQREAVVLQLMDGQVSREVVQEKSGSTKGKLVPTPSGELIADFLTDHFDQIVDYGFTANVEEEFDQIANNELDRNKMLMDFYKPFHQLIEKSGGIDRSKVGANREIGIDPKTKKPIIARFGRFGPMLQLGSTEDKTEKPQFAPLPAGARIETVTLDQALEMFKLPRTVGKTEDGQEIKANIGRFGPYIQVGKLFVSIKPEDPHTITLEKSLELYREKLKAEAEKNIADFGDGIKVLNGRYGPYITNGKKNVKIPKDTDPKSITHEQAKDMIANAPTTKRRAPRRKAK
ncbi:type I DNA topoisomerase [Candidatus Saccharibacteria bacterium]|jgi:DNA topoisomerase-1|nr:type I DNA topoisomerase [Candidatus Saccharibacteria bacterium]